MITPVSFEIAKLLKEKGFDEPCRFVYDTWDNIQDWLEDGDGEHRNSHKNGSVYYSAPTIAEVVMWLYKEHGIWISVDWMTRKKPFNSGFYCHLRGTLKPLNQDNFIVINDTLDPGYEVFNSPTEAYEAAIIYTLKKINIRR